jgi:phenylalanyl-tRNA synthetase beta chain
MPTLNVNRDLLFSRIGKTFSDEQFDELCFQFGIELDEITSERQQVAREQGALAAKDLSDDVIYKIELPANRYDLMSLDGLARAVKSYLGDGSEGARFVDYPLAPATTKLTVKKSVKQVRPYAVAAILRDITFTQQVYDGFIELQDKLHNGIGRKRTIVSMGTHDLDTISGPFTYEAVAPQEIHFCPLNQTKEMSGVELMQFYEHDLKLKKFLPIIRDSPVYPVILDSKRTVCSLPPIINSDHSKIKLSTKNVFVEVTGTDLNKLNVALNVICTSFVGYCGQPIEAVEVVYEDQDNTVVMTTPDMSSRTETVTVEYINRCVGVQFTADQVVSLLVKMMLPAKKLDSDKVLVTIPCIRSDILHACDIMEDVAIAYGFNNIPRTLPKTLCTASAQPLNKLGDLLRREVALAGYTEVLTLTLCSRKENYDYLLRKDPGNEAVVLASPKTLEYEVVHTMLMPEMLKTVSANRCLPLPLKIFQVADVVLLDNGHEVGARNERHLSAVICNNSSGFEVVHGLLDRVMRMLAVPLHDYSIRPSSLPFYFEGRQAQVLYKGSVIGHFGIVHPDVLSNFEVPNVASHLEMNIEPFL